jgi:YD repeat-containing protein
MLGSITRLLGRQLTSSSTDRRLLVAIAVIGFGGNAYLWRNDLAQYGRIMKMKWRERVLPLTWPRHSLEAGVWASAPPGERYRYARDALQRLPGMTRTDVGQLLGETPTGDRWLWKLKPAGDVNLWYVLTVEFAGDRVSHAAVVLVWLDP